MNKCERCGGDVGNAGLDKCAIVSDIDEEAIVQRYLCRENKCADRVLPKNLVVRSRGAKT